MRHPAAPRDLTAPRIRPRIRVTRGTAILIGPGKADLLEAIGETGALRDAASRLGMSYMRAWQLLHLMNAAFREPLVSTARGGTGHGSAKLTPTGESVLGLYREMESASRRALSPAWRRLRRLLR